MIIVKAQSREESIFVHVASSLDKAVEWVKKYSNGWHEEEYCFFAFEATIDKDDYIDEGVDNAVFIDVQGNVSKENPLFK